MTAGCRRCGHARDAHAHYRVGTECALCPRGGCSRYRRPRPWTRRQAPLDDGCAWCRPLGRYGDISILPSDCECDDACDAPWCQRGAVIRP